MLDKTDGGTSPIEAGWQSLLITMPELSEQTTEFCASCSSPARHCRTIVRDLFDPESDGEKRYRTLIDVATEIKTGNARKCCRKRGAKQ
jgi:hypothetical protein